MQSSSKVSACQRELGSHTAASPLSSAERELKMRLRGSAPQQRREEDQKAREGVSRQECEEAHAAKRSGQVALARACIALRARPSKVSLWGRRCRCSVAFAQRLHERRTQNTGRHIGRRGMGSFAGAPSIVAEPWQVHCLQSVAAALPNPALKRTRRGGRRLAFISFWAKRHPPLRSA